MPMPQEFLDDPVLLDQPITSLSIQIHTVDAKNAETDDKVYCNVVFKDGSLLKPENFRLDTSGHNDFERGATDTYHLPIPEGLDRKIAEIDEFYIRKSGSNGWLLGSALLFANLFELPVIGNSQINQFLDDDEEVLFLRDWSTRSLCSSSDVPAKYPLLCPQYRIAGPVLGQVSDTSANVLYRVDQEGKYRLTILEAASNQVVFDEVQTLSPTATFCVTRLQPNTHYKISFFHVYNNQGILVPDGGGEFRTFPAEDSGVNFSFAFASCSSNQKNVAQSAWIGIKNLGADPSVDPVKDPSNGVRFFIHLGDTFYFYDDVTDEEPKNLRTVLAANLSQRRHPRFLEMARAIPCCAVWDDHDFRKNDEQSTNYPAKADSLKGFLDYWGNNTLNRAAYGLTTLLSYGNVDIYLLDGRFRRDKDSGICFTQGQLNYIVALITRRGTTTDRLVIIASGSTWNHTNTDGDEEAYGNDSYEAEREDFYEQLNDRIGNQIKGLVFLSGDIHINEIYEIVLASGSRGSSKVAPEFVSSPLGNNTSLCGSANDVTGERKWSVPSSGDRARRGFATLEIDTTATVPDGGWTIKVRYYDENASVTTPYYVKEYSLSGGQFVF